MIHWFTRQLNSALHLALLINELAILVQDHAHEIEITTPNSLAQHFKPRFRRCCLEACQRPLRHFGLSHTPNDSRDKAGDWLRRCQDSFGRFDGSQRAAPPGSRSLERSNVETRPFSAAVGRSCLKSAGNRQLQGALSFQDLRPCSS